MCWLIDVVVAGLAMVCALGAAPAAEKRPATSEAVRAAFEQFLSKAKAKQPDEIRKTLVLPRGPRDPGAEEDVNDLLDAINGGLFTNFDPKVIDTHVEDDVAVVVVEMRQQPGRNPEVAPFYLLREGDRWKVVPTAGPFERRPYLTDAQAKSLLGLHHWFERRNPPPRRPRNTPPDDGDHARRKLNGDLVLAAMRGEAGEVERLLAEGADVNGEGFSSGSALQAAATSGRLEIIRLLVKKGAQVSPAGEPLLFEVLRRKQREAAKLLIELGTETDRSWKSNTALGLATYAGYADVVKALLAKGADPHAKVCIPGSFERTTLLHHAAASGDLATFDAVRPSFPDLKITDDLNRTALHAVARSESYPHDKDQAAITDVLLKAGLDPHARMKRDDLAANFGVPLDTPLRIAAASSTPAVVDRLLDRVKYEPDELTFVLCLSIRQCPTTIVAKLLDKGADVHGKSHVEKTTMPPEYIAAQRRRADVLKLLLERGANPNAVEASTGRTPLLTAVAAAEPDLVAVLVDAGADPTAKDKSGKDAAALLAERKEHGREGWWPGTQRSPELSAIPDAPKQIEALLARAKPAKRPAK